MNENLPAALAGVHGSETRLSERLRIEEECARLFEVSANAASEREAMKARGVMESPSHELLRLQREESVALSRLKAAKTEVGSFGMVADKICSRQRAYHDAAVFSRRALTHRDRHDVLKNNPVEMERPIDILRRTERHASCSEQWLPNGTKSVLVRTKPHNEAHLFTVDRRDRLILTNSPCPNDCGFLVTWHGTRCCDACAADGRGGHGPRCDRKALGCQTGARSKLSKWKADQKKRDRDMKIALQSSNRCAEKAKKCVQTADRLGAEALRSIPPSVMERHPGICDSIRSVDFGITGGAIRGGSSCRDGGCSPPPAELIQRGIAAAERAQGMLAEQLSIVEHLARLVEGDAERFEQNLLTVRSLEQEESDRIFRRLRDRVRGSAAGAPPPAMNPSYRRHHPGSIPPSAPPAANPALTPSAPAEEEFFCFSGRPVIEDEIGFSSAVPSSSPSLLFRARPSPLPPNDGTTVAVGSRRSGTATDRPAQQARTGSAALAGPAMSMPPEATILGASLDQDTIPMVDATLVRVVATEIV